MNEAGYEPMPDGVEAPYITPDIYMKAVLIRTFQRPPYNTPTPADIEGVKIQIEMDYILNIKGIEDDEANARFDALEKRFGEIKADPRPKNFPIWQDSHIDDDPQKPLWVNAFLDHLKTHSGELSDMQRAVAAYNNLSLLDSISTQDH